MTTPCAAEPPRVGGSAPREQDDNGVTLWPDRYSEAVP